MRAESLAEESEFFSFGTAFVLGDLTEAAFSFSREDAENKFLPLYTESVVLRTAFEVLDEKGVGKLMELAVQWGRKVKADLLVGICGEHGGHPAAIAFCDKIGMDYVSCSDPRVPVVRLAALHAAIGDGRDRDVARLIDAMGESWQPNAPVRPVVSGAAAAAADTVTERRA